jgi:purine-cytosine permease-like protein
MNKEEYGEQFSEHMLEQYKLYVEMADRVSSRRAQTNRFYISLLSILLALLSIVASIGPFSEILDIILLAMAILGIILCAVWWVNIRSYRQLNSGKFEVIHEMERELPIAAYDKEWEILGRGKLAGKYLQLTRVEQWVPLILSIPYLLLLVYSVVR